MDTRETAGVQTPEWGLTVLRVVVGLTFFMHGWQKVFQQRFDGVGQFFGMIGIPAPGFFAVIVSLVELVGGLALILGLLTRLAALLLLIDNLVAMFVVHVENGFFVSGQGQGPGVELVLVLAAANVALILAGPGAAAIDNLLAERGMGGVIIGPRRARAV